MKPPEEDVPHSQKATDLLHNPDFLFVISKVISAGL